ncbi:MAG TPA: hypothetical protein DC060_00650 [Gemmatimonadetes bacterium]|nr:hypothetical protein [Gemmatimonadota bacterium]HIC53839.1 hypothetical protein [Gemmatimonadota bacterium]
MDTLGGSVQLTNGISAGSPSWSPDGLRIAFTRSSDSGSSIYVVGRDGSALSELVSGVQAGAVAWSPGGNTIAYSTLGGSVDSHMFLFDLTTSVTTQLTQPDSINRNLSWSPDGSQAVFESNRSGIFQIYRMEADGSDVVGLSDVSGGARDPAWSPRGTQIAFASSDSGGLSIYLMQSDGSNVQILTDQAGSDYTPTWSPDCSRVAFASDRNVAVASARNIWVASVGGSGLRQVSSR